jgi:hypothetical protein
MVLFFLFQGCTIYQKKSVSHEKAFEASRKVKIITVDNRKMYFAKIEIDNNVLFGIKRIKGESFRIIMPIHDIKEIHLTNKTANQIRAVLIVVGIVVIIPFTIYAVALSQLSWQ